MTNRDRRAEAFLPRIRILAARFAANRGRGRVRADAEELESAGLVGLAEAIAGADPGRDFEAFATAVVRRVMIDHIRASNPLGYRASKDRRGLQSYPVDQTIEDEDVARSHRAFDDVDDSDWAGAVVALLPPDEARLVRVHFFEARGRKFRDCAKILGLPVAAAYRIRRRAIDRLRVGLQSNNL